MCSRSGAPRDRNRMLPGEGGRESSTIKCGCRFRVLGALVGGKWACSFVHRAHNHPPAADFAGFAVARKMGDECKGFVREMTLLDVPPNRILSGLREKFPTQLIVVKDLYNTVAAIRREFLSGLSPPAAVSKLLSLRGYISKLVVVFLLRCLVCDLSCWFRCW